MKIHMRNLVLIFSVLLSGYASADYLLWTVSGKTGNSKTSSGWSVDGIEYQFASIKYTTDKTGTWNESISQGASTVTSSSSDYTGPGFNGGAFTAPSSTVVADLSTIGDNYAAGYFFIELYDSENSVVGHSELANSSTLEAYLKTEEFNSNWQNLSSWGGGSFSAPEPTSGLLMLVGAALLGLRRKRVA